MKYKYRHQIDTLREITFTHKMMTDAPTLPAHKCKYKGKYKRNTNQIQKKYK